jgi:hypothetical protein
MATGTVVYSLYCPLKAWQMSLHSQCLVDVDERLRVAVDQMGERRDVSLGT